MKHILVLKIILFYFAISQQEIFSMSMTVNKGRSKIISQVKFNTFTANVDLNKGEKLLGEQNPYTLYTIENDNTKNIL